MDNSVVTRAAVPPSVTPSAAPPVAVAAAPAPNFLAQLWDARTARVLFTGLIFFLVIAFFLKAHETLTLFLFAILFAYFLVPLVTRLQRPVRGRGRAIALVYVLLACVLAGLGFAVGPTIADEGKQLITSLPSLVDRLGSGELVAEFGQAHRWTGDRIHQVQAFLMQHRTDILAYGRGAAERLASPAQHIWWLILIPILSLFFLLEGEEMATGTVDLGRSTEERNVIHGLLYDVNMMLGSYIRAQITLSALTLVAYTLVLSLLRVPYAFILGPVAGFLEFIPVVGPAIAAVSVLAIAVLAGYPHSLWLIVFLGAWRLVQDYISAPRIMGKSLEINPLTQIFAVLAGAEIAGVVGALVSVPVVAILRIIWRRVASGQGGNTAIAVAPGIKART